jgi:acyl carrier protein
MNPQELHSRLQDIFRQVFDSEALEIRDETAASDIEGWDSLAQINIVVGAEDRFGVRFQTAEIRALKNVGDFKRLIAGKLAAK